MRATSSSARSPSDGATSRSPNADWSPMRRRRASSTPARGENGIGGDVGSLQGESLVALNARAGRSRPSASWPRAPIASRGRRATTAEVNASTQALRQQRAALEAEYQEKLTRLKPDHPDMVSLRSRIDELDRQIRAEAGNVAGGRSNTLLAEYQAAAAAERALQGRVEPAQGLGAQPARPQHPVQYPPARGGHQPRAL